MLFNWFKFSRTNFFIFSKFLKWGNPRLSLDLRENSQIRNETLRWSSLPVWPLCNLVPRVLSYPSLRSEREGKRENLGTRLTAVYFCTDTKEANSSEILDLWIGLRVEVFVPNLCASFWDLSCSYLVHFLSVTSWCLPSNLCMTITHGWTPSLSCLRCYNPGDTKNSKLFWSRCSVFAVESGSHSKFKYTKQGHPTRI